MHIAQACSDELNKNSIKKTALLGTKYTMEQDFYKQKLIENGIEVIIPDKKDIEIINDVIFNELCRGIINQNSKNEFLRIIDDLTDKGACGVILGCTEIGFLLNQSDVKIPVFDTTIIHAQKAAKCALI